MPKDAKFWLSTTSTTATSGTSPPTEPWRMDFDRSAKAKVVRLTLMSGFAFSNSAIDASIELLAVSPLR